ncbi:radical sam [Desulfoluna butyratoxydans]|uniref:Radical sam n=2 Tax=Desulfoluna butyratoxydans TaxID=231438 RepID=A0A4V6IL55_9BACT|nr:radical SAM protein [Desulfoluna butyratoxydans]VFQ43848.1 radical sam [Desulfoluna butyratoxydans]
MPSTERSSTATSQSESLAIHITEQCNMRCSYCYLKNRLPGRISREDVDLAMELVTPRKVFFYGGECLLYKKFLWKIIGAYPGIQFFVVTNGKLLDFDFLHRLATVNMGVITSLDSLDLDECNPRGMTRKHQASLISNLRNARSFMSASLLHTVGPWTVGLAKYQSLANELQANIDYCVLISDDPCKFESTPFAKALAGIPQEVIQDLSREYSFKPPKLRLHVNGELSYSFKRGSRFSLGYVTSLKSIPERMWPCMPACCRDCSLHTRCQLANIFPEAAGEFASKGTLKASFACQLTNNLLT